MWRRISKSGLVSWIGPWKGAALVTLFFVTVASFLFWLDFFRAYETELQVLVIGKNTVSSAEISANLAEVAGTLAFYERLLVHAEDLEDPFTGLAPDRKKEAWQSKVRVKKVRGTETLILTARDASIEGSRLWSRESAETLFAVASFYYNIRTDAEVRIIDGPFTKRVVERPVPYVLTSVASAFLLTVVFFLVLRLSPAFFEKLRKYGRKDLPQNEKKEGDADVTSAYHIGESVPLIDPKKFLPSRPRALRFEEKLEDHKRNLPFSSVFSSKASAPANLPISPEAEKDEGNAFERKENVPENLPFAEADFSLPDRTEEIIGEPAEHLTAGPAVPEIAEPTPEEYKARLNKLLSNGKQ